MRLRECTGNTYKTLKELICFLKFKLAYFKEMIFVLLLISGTIPMDMNKTHKDLGNNESFNIKISSY